MLQCFIGSVYVCCLLVDDKLILVFLFYLAFTDDIGGIILMSEAFGSKVEIGNKLLSL